MYDIHVILDHSPGSLASLGRILGMNGVGLEGGGVFSTAEAGHAHFLIEDGEKARQVLTDAGFDVRKLSRPLIRKLPETAGRAGRNRQTLAGMALTFWYSTATTITGLFC